MQKIWKTNETLAHGYSSECSARAVKWIPILQGLDDFQKYLRSYALDESSLSIGRVKIFHHMWWRNYESKTNTIFHDLMLKIACLIIVVNPSLGVGVPLALGDVWKSGSRNTGENLSFPSQRAVYCAGEELFFQVTVIGKNQRLYCCTEWQQSLVL